MNNIAFFFNRNDLNIDSLKKIQKQWNKPIYKADLWDYGERQDFELLELECKTAYDYYSKLYKCIENKKYIVDVPIPYDSECWNDSIISDEVKMELKKTVEILHNYYKKSSNYSSTFDERNY